MGELGVRIWARAFFWLFGVFEDVVNLEMDKTWQDVWFRGSKLG